MENKKKKKSYFWIPSCKWMQSFSGECKSCAEKNAKVVPMNAKFLRWTQKLCQQLQTFSGELSFFFFFFRTTQKLCEQMQHFSGENRSCINECNIFQERKKNAKIVQTNAKIIGRMQKLWQWTKFLKNSKVVSMNASFTVEHKSCVNELKLSWGMQKLCEWMQNSQ